MAVITNPLIEEYLMSLAGEVDPRMLEMERIGKERNFPIVDRLVGRLLHLLTRIKRPGLIVELGSGFGYSAYWFSLALGEGRIILTDRDQGNLTYAEGMFREAGLSALAEFRCGDAIEIAKEYRDIDILFIDIEKYRYTEAVVTLLPNLCHDAIVIADNSLWYGKVVEEEKDRDTEGILEFNAMMFSRADFLSVIVPIRDGVLVAQRLSGSRDRLNAAADELHR